MKPYRLITFLAALLITVFIARALTDKKVTLSQDQVPGAAEQAP